MKIRKVYHRGGKSKNETVTISRRTPEDDKADGKVTCKNPSKTQDEGQSSSKQTPIPPAAMICHKTEPSSL